MENSDDDEDLDYRPSDEESKSSITESAESSSDSDDDEGSNAQPIYMNPLAKYRPGPSAPGSKNPNSPSPGGSEFLPLRTWTEKIVEVSQGTGSSPHQFRSSKILLHGIPANITDQSDNKGYGEFFMELYQIGERTGLLFHEKRILKLFKGGAWEIFPDAKSSTHSMIIPLMEERMFSVAPTRSQFPIFLNLTVPWRGLSSGEPVTLRGDYSIQAIPNEFTKLSDIGDELVVFRGVPNDICGAGTEAFLFLIHNFLTNSSCAQPEELNIITYPHYSSRATRSRSASTPTVLFKEWLCIGYYTITAARQTIRVELALPQLSDNRLVHFPAWTLVMATSVRSVLRAPIRPLATPHRVSRVKRIKPGVSFFEALTILGNTGENERNLPRFPMGWLEMGEWHASQDNPHNMIVLLTGTGPEVPLEILGYHQSQLGIDENGRNKIEVWAGILEGTGPQTKYYQSRVSSPKKSSSTPAARNKRPTSSARTAKPSKSSPAIDHEGFTQVQPKRSPRAPLRTASHAPSQSMSVGGGGGSVSSLGGRSYLSAAQSDSARSDDQTERLPTTLQRGYNIRHQLRTESQTREGLSDLTKTMWTTWKDAHPTSNAQLRRLSAHDLARADKRRLEMNGPDPIVDLIPAAQPPPPDLHLARFLGYILSTQCDEDMAVHGKLQHVNSIAFLKWKGTYPAQLSSIRNPPPALKSFWDQAASVAKTHLSVFIGQADHPLHKVLTEGIYLQQLHIQQATLPPQNACWSTSGAFARWQARAPEVAMIVEYIKTQLQTGVNYEDQAIQEFQRLIEIVQEADIRAEEARQDLPPPPSDLVLLKGFIIQSRIREYKTGSAERTLSDAEWTDWSDFHPNLIRRVRNPTVIDRLAWQTQYQLTLDEMVHLNAPCLQETLWEGLLLRSIRDTKTEAGELSDYLPFQQWQEDFPEAQEILSHTDMRNGTLRSQAQCRIASKLALELHIARTQSAAMDGGYDDEDPGENPKTLSMHEL